MNAYREAMRSKLRAMRGARAMYLGIVCDEAETRAAMAAYDREMEAGPLGHLYPTEFERALDDAKQDPP
jgi:hypothetical protein